VNVSAQTFIGTDLGKSEVANQNATVSKTAAVQPVAAAQTAVAPEPLPIGNVQSPPGIQATKSYFASGILIVWNKETCLRD